MTRQRQFDFMFDHIAPVTFAHALYVVCRIVSRVLRNSLQVGEPAWIEAANAGIIEGKVWNLQDQRTLDDTFDLWGGKR